MSCVSDVERLSAIALKSRGFSIEILVFFGSGSWDVELG